MRAATQAQMIDAVRMFVHAWRGNVPDPSRWQEIAALMEGTWETYMQEVADATGEGFDGAVYDPALDDDRLHRQLGRVWNAMADGQWHTIEALATVTGDPENSVSAQLRHLRKTRHGSWIIDKERLTSNGLYAYRMRNPDGEPGPPWLPVVPQ